MDAKETVDAGVRGLPRPILDGLPAPYTGADDYHGSQHDERHAEAKIEQLCAVCGEGLSECERVYVGLGQSAIHIIENPDAYDARPGFGIDSLLDGGVGMHLRCAQLSLAHCPNMRYGKSIVTWLTQDEYRAFCERVRFDIEFVAALKERRLMLKSTSEDDDTAGRNQWNANRRSMS